MKTCTFPPNPPTGTRTTARQLAEKLLEYPDYEVLVTNWCWTEDAYADECLSVNHERKAFEFESNA